jgi:hypothetical protein
MILEVGFTRSPGLAPSQRLGLGFPTDRPKKPRFYLAGPKRWIRLNHPRKPLKEHGHPAEDNEVVDKQYSFAS